MRSYQVDMCNGPILKKLIVFVNITDGQAHPIR